MASPTSTVSLNILDDARAAYENISQQLRQLMSEKDAHVLEYTSLLQSRADEEQRQDLQEVIASEKEEITILKESLQDLAKTILNMENPPNFTLFS
ncbi:hypothetical protein K7432_016353 [Basidiobolus ranarum]|uniref:Mediator of RNA polymerase II transcription subunit 21 n=1 Tax=Basidiobolus ranarum TaxID=34480 RepID=A0ABR2VLP9_9FUNG